MIRAADIPKLYNRHGSLKAIHRAHAGEIGWRKLLTLYREAVAAGLMPVLPFGRKSHGELKLPLPKQRAGRLKTQTKRHKAYILTCAQNNTDVHQKTFQNLVALAAHYEATLMVSTFLYARRSAWQAKLGKSTPATSPEIWYDPAVVPYINNSRVEIAKGLVWCGELNIIPTAERPLSGLEVYTGRASMIVPHTHVQMQSIATVGGSGTKFNYTTGTVTLRNYIQRKEGFKAEFHHVYGGLLVETDDEGRWWVRQLIADSDGTIYDLDVCAEDGEVTTGHRVEAITFGDAHVEEMDEDVAAATWGEGGMVDALAPHHQFIHDVLDFRARDYHRKDDPYPMFKRYCEKREGVEQEVKNVAAFLRKIGRDDCAIVVVNSNHDRFLYGWLAKNDGRKDPVNAEFWSRLNLEVIRYIREHGVEPDCLALAMSWIDENCTADFLPMDKSYVILKDFGGGIECSLHGDQGPNGARGALRSFAKMGRRSNVGHSHVAGIDGGAYQTGTKSKLRLEYNHGPSAWSHSDIITYPNSKRAIVTFFDGKWRP